MLNVFVNRPGAGAKNLANFGIGFSLGDPEQNFRFTGGKTEPSERRCG
jgi:hypothetical protein